MGLVIAKVTLPSGERDSEYDCRLVGCGWYGGGKLNIGTAQHPDIAFISPIHSFNWPCYFELKKTEYRKAVFFNPTEIQIPHIDPANKIIWLGDVRP